MAVDVRVPEGEDAPLLDLLDALVDDRGRVASVQALGVNYRTVTRCRQSRRVSRRMREVLEEFRDSQDGGDAEAGTVGGDDAEVAQRDRAVELERENRDLRETVEAQAAELETLRRRVAELEERVQEPDKTDAVDGGHGQPGELRSHRRAHEVPDARVVTLDEQPDEDYAFGPAAPLVAEWRKLRTGGDQAGSRIDRAVAAVRRWELEAAMLRDFHLTLPPETEPLEETTRKDHVRWREDALAEARRKLSKAKRARLLRRLATLGLWWR